MSYGGVFEYTFSYEADDVANDADDDDEPYVANHDVIMQVSIF